eukprot:jgi/Mesen1/7286/ME000373S06357
MDTRTFPAWRMQSISPFLTTHVLFVLLSPLLQGVPCGSQALYTDTAVVELTFDSFNEKVLSTSDCWIVEFYAPWCSHCLAFRPEYIKAAENVGEVIHFGAINGHVQRDLVERYSVRFYPAIFLFGQNKQQQGPSEYHGRHSSAAIEHLVLAFVASNGTVVAQGVAGAWNRAVKVLLERSGTVAIFLVAVFAVFTFGGAVADRCRAGAASKLVPARFFPPVRHLSWLRHFHFGTKRDDFELAVYTAILTCVCASCMGWLLS